MDCQGLRTGLYGHSDELVGVRQRSAAVNHHAGRPGGERILGMLRREDAGGVLE